MKCANKIKKANLLISPWWYCPYVLEVMKVKKIKYINSHILEMAQYNVVIVTGEEINYLPMPG